ncbi:MAG: hypothetical protein AB7T38_11420 [Nitrospirales bacterium]
MMTVQEAIAHADRVLIHQKASAAEGDKDPRWQAVIAVADFIPTEPEPIWQFVCRWAELQDDDLRNALSTCVLEHILEYHFEKFFPLVKIAVRRNEAIADVFLRCWKFGLSEVPENAVHYEKLRKELKTGRKGK